MTAPTMPLIDLPPPDAQIAAPPRPIRRAMLRGAGRHCPACGEGALFQGYLSVANHCSRCDEALHHQRADDGPAYITIMIIAHVFVPLLMLAFVVWRPPVAVMLIGFSVAAIASSLALLPMVKGAMIGVQWARRMHGFGTTSAPGARAGTMTATAPRHVR